MAVPRWRGPDVGEDREKAGEIGKGREEEKEGKEEGERN